MKIPKNNLTYKPLIYSPKTDELKIISLINKGAIVIDELQGQLKEFIKIKNPSKSYDEATLLNLAENYTHSPFHYGVWVYYPWNNQLIHLLPENEFIAVRTSRNKHKITEDEQQLLNRKKVGIIGLSVGHSVAITLAMERAFGELRLCDFDVLELSNYNRIRTKLSHLGVKKTVSVAREIAEIDPFLKVVCFHDGLTLDNIESFFTHDGLLDLCIDECDGIDMKIHCRLWAKKLGVPVIMEASDNCTLDVERFDLDATRPILHGNLEALDLEKVSTLKTAEEKLPYMLAFMPPQMLSAKMAASMIELKSSIGTWPQLASAVNYGGGICASISRQILLGDHTSSGRWQLNVGEYFSDNSKTVELNSFPLQPKTLINDSFSESIGHFSEIYNLSKLEKHIDQIVNDACLAPSGGNKQPWYFHFDKNKGLFLFLDKSESSNTIDYNFFPSLISLGAACENLLLSAEHYNVPLAYKLYDNYLNGHPLAHFYPTEAKVHPKPDLYNFLHSRQTNRMLGDKTVISNELLQKLSKNTAYFDKFTIKWLAEDQLEQFANIFGKIERARLLDKECHKETIAEIRWTKEEEKTKGNGILVDSFDLTHSERTSLDFLKRGDALQLISKWDLGQNIVNMFKKTINTSSAIGIICTKGDDYKDFFDTGRLLERVWLEATSYDLAFQPVSPVTLLYFSQKKGANKHLNPNTIHEIKTQYNLLSSLLNLSEEDQPFFVFRLAKTNKKTPFSIRKKTPLNTLN